MAALKQITSLTKVFKAVAASRTTQALASKNFYTYSKEPAYPIPDKEPCWVKSAEEALQQAGLSSGWLFIVVKFFCENVN